MGNEGSSYLFVSIICLIIGFFIGVMIVGTGSGVAVVEENALDIVCKNTFGEKYIFLDTNGFKVETEITCIESKIESIQVIIIPS